MANFVLDKGYLATGVAAYTLGMAVVLQSNGKSVAPAAADAVGVVMACMEDIDAAKVATGKAVINCRMMGIARVQLGAVPGAVVVGSRLRTDAAAKYILAPAGTTFNVVGVALQAGVANDYIDALVVVPSGLSGAGT